ncbi:MAG TPA: DUF4145 domain-containing protein [Verrucomicrobiae bacterium]|nr:DUF4145 domain-containing protein [Verrucomicrobiae bacterium]
MPTIEWQSAQGLPSFSYVCGYCGNPLASALGWSASFVKGGSRHSFGRIYVCHHCSRPTFIDSSDGKQTPGFSFGEPVKNISDKDLNAIYEEARTATSAGCYTAAVLCCRKLLMHLAVAKGAKEGDTFKRYVEYLADNHHVPPACKGWVEQIKDAGNEANHVVKMMNREDAEHLVSFCEMLLKIFYEFPAVALARNGGKTN